MDSFFLLLCIVAQGLIPLLANLLHDTAEKVRVAFIRILCKVRVCQ